MLSRVPALKFPFRMWRGRGVESAARTGRARDRPRYIAPVLASSGLWILAASLVFFAGALSALPAPARASPLFPICTDHPRGYDPFKAADVVAEGVLLSGPSFHGALLSPARFHVVRYLKDRGPRVIRIRTPQRQVATDTVRYLGDGQYGIVPEFARIPDNAQTPRAGEAYRIFARTRRRHGKRREVMHRIDTCTGDDRRISIRRLLRPVPRTLVRRRGGRELWSASLYRRRGRPHCLRLFTKDSDPHAYLFGPRDHGACGSLRRRRATLIAVDTGSSATGVALAGNGLRGFTASRLSDGVSVAATARAGVALALLPRGLERREIGIIARYRDGSTRMFGNSERRVSVADPLGSSPWVAEHERAYPGTAARRACVVLWLDPRLGRSGNAAAPPRSSL